jgi:hypothetical protein
MTIKFDLHQPRQDAELIAMYKKDFDLDVGRKYTFVPELQGFQLHLDHSVVLAPETLRDDADVRFYLQTHGINPGQKSPIANLDYELLQLDEINF